MVIIDFVLALSKFPAAAKIFRVAYGRLLRDNASAFSSDLYIFVDGGR